MFCPSSILVRILPIPLAHNRHLSVFLLILWEQSKFDRYFRNRMRWVTWLAQPFFDFFTDWLVLYARMWCVCVVYVYLFAWWARRRWNGDSEFIFLQMFLCMVYIWSIERMKSIFITVQSLWAIRIKFAGGEKSSKKKNNKQLRVPQHARKESQEDRCRIGEDIQHLQIASITGRHCFWVPFCDFLLKWV